ncbi:hypothetical protein L3V86_04960 [Thiotrichales bacterium 19S11-10]|nr:hypothetical protein [Thiotrichales bacterium 19S11-10]
MAKRLKIVITMMVALAIIGVLYVWGVRYTSKMAHDEAEVLITKIEKQASGIKDISYKSIDIGLFSIFTHKFSIEHVSMTLNGQPVHIESIDVLDFEQKEGRLSHMNIVFDGASFNVKKEGPVKSYLDLIQARKSQLDQVIANEKSSNPNYTDPVIEAYQGWFTVLDAVSNKYANAKLILSLVFDKDDKTLLVNADVFVKGNEKPIYKMKANLIDFAFDRNLDKDLLGAKLGDLNINLNLEHILKTESKASNDAVKAFLKGIDPSLEMEIKSEAKSKLMSFDIQVDNSYELEKGQVSSQDYQGDLTLGNITLSQYPVEDVLGQTKSLLGFEKAYVVTSHSHVDADFKFSKDYILEQANNIGLKAIVDQFPYQDYDLYLKGNANYDDHSHQYLTDMAMGFKDKLDIELKTDVAVTKPLLVSDYVKLVMSRLEAQADENNQDLIGSLNALEESINEAKIINEKMKLRLWEVTIKNHNDFLENINQALASIFQLTAKDMQGILKSSFDVLITSNKDELLPYKAYKQALNEFIDKPEQLTLLIKPKPPVSLDQFYHILFGLLSYQMMHEETETPSMNKDTSTSFGEQGVKKVSIPLVVGASEKVSQAETFSKEDKQQLKKNLDQLNITLKAN